MSTCRNIASEIAAGRLSGDDVSELMDRLETIKKNLDGLDNVEGRLMAEGRAIASDIAAAALIEKRNRLKNIVVESRLLNSIELADAAVGNPVLGFKAAMVTINTPIEGAQRSVDTLGKGIEHSYVGGLLHDLKKANVYVAFSKMKGDLERDVVRALSDLNMREPTGVNVSRDAQEIAKVMHKYQKVALTRENRAGAFIREREGYVVRQSHDAARMARQGRDAWKAEMLNRADFQKMEVAPERIGEYLDSAYDAITTGIRLTDEVAPIEKAFKGPGNLAKKESAARNIVFKSADDWYEYDKRFGQGSLREAFIAQLSSSAKATALMEVMGTNPKAMFDRVIEKSRRKYRNDPKKLAGFKTGPGWRLEDLEAQFAEIDGSVNFGSSTGVAQIAAGFRAVQTMAKLGFAVASAMGDIAYGATARIYQGKSVMDAWGNALAVPFEGLSGGDKRHLADLLAAGLEGQLGTLHSRFNAADNVPGMMSKMMNTYFKLNLLGPWTDANKRGATFALARDLAIAATKPFDGLSDAHKRLLSVYGIDARQWEVARLAVKEAGDGRAYMMPGDVDAVRGAPFTGLTSSQQQRLRDQVRENLFTLLTNEADFSSPSPGARERAIMRRGHAPGTLAGEMLRFLGQFKSFSVVSMTKGLGRHTYGAGATNFRQAAGMALGGNMGAVNTIVGTTVLGYFVMQLKEMMKGREPRPNTPETFLAAMLQGGGLGIYGDFLFGEASRYGGGTLETLAGPGVGAVADVIDLVQRARGVVTGGEEDLRGDVVRLVKSNTPFANLFYLKGAMDYLIWYQMQEMINPGYLKRMERRVERQNNQQFYMPPSSIVARGGGFR